MEDVDDAPEQVFEVGLEAGARLKGWRSDVAHKLVFGDGELATDLVPIEEQLTPPAETVV